MSGHQRVGADDSSATLKETRQYLRDFSGIADEQPTIEGERDNPRVIWHSARTEVARRSQIWSTTDAYRWRHRVRAERLPSRWAVLAADLATAEDLATSAQQLGIPVVALGRADGRHSPALLIRPDGHLGWGGTRGRDMVAWLQRCIVGERPLA